MDVEIIKRGELLLEDLYARLGSVEMVVFAGRNSEEDER